MKWSYIKFHKNKSNTIYFSKFVFLYSLSIQICKNIQEKWMKHATILESVERFLEFNMKVQMKKCRYLYFNHLNYVDTIIILT